MVSHTIFDFNVDTSLQNWVIVDDIVMGGRSSGSFSISNEGHGLYQGKVSVENNGGFSSLRHNFETLDVQAYTHVVLKVKGDGKNYQFRVKAQAQDYYSYITTFPTTGEWQEIEILLADMYPSFRGRTLNMPNFAQESIEEIRFLIGNKIPENFKLLIDKIELR